MNVRDTGQAVAVSHIGFRAIDGLSDQLTDFVNRLERVHYGDDIRVVDKSHTGVGWAVPDTDPLTQPVPNEGTGTVFDNESDEMRAACRGPIRKHLDADVSLDEVRHQRTGYHTDLVYVDIDQDRLRERVELFGTEPLHDPLQRFKVWWWVYERAPVTYDDAVEQGCYSDPSKNRRHADWLLDHGYLARGANDVVTAIFPQQIGDVHAVELKLRDWETALDQAARANRSEAPDYQPARRQDRYGYADYRWVALDAGAVGNAVKHAAQFRDAGVGLLGIGGGGTVVELIEAEERPRGRFTRDRAWVQSEAVAELTDIDATPASEPQGKPRQLGIDTY